MNQFITYRLFKMELLRSILACIRDTDWMTSIDLKEAYLHIPIQPSHHHFLRFAYHNCHFHYRAMPFGLSSAPRTFTKILAAVAVSLRQQPVRVLCYLDDVLILSSLPAQAIWDLEVVCHCLQQHGFSLNIPKSHFQSTTQILYLGTIIDSVKGQVFLSSDRCLSIRSLISQVLASQRVPLILLLCLLRKMISCLSVVPWA